MVMESTLRKFETMRLPGAFVLSIYANMSENTWPGPLINITNKVRALLDEAPNETYRKSLRREWDMVEQWLRQWSPNGGQALALFSAKPYDLWAVWRLPVAVPDEVRFEETAYTSPLLALLDEYERYGVVLVDQGNARFYTMQLGMLEEQELVRSDVVRKHGKGGGSAQRYAQRHVETSKKHLSTVAQELDRLLQRKQFDRLVLSGQADVRTQLEKALPEAVRARIVGRLALPVETSAYEVLTQTMRVEEKVERAEEERAVREVTDTASKGGPAVVGLDPVIHALLDGNARGILVAQGWKVGGKLCRNCGYVVVANPGACPRCNRKMERASDLVDHVVAAALDQGTRVEFVSGKAASALKDAGNIGAMLKTTERAPRRKRRTS